MAGVVAGQCSTASSIATLQKGPCRKFSQPTTLVHTWSKAAAQASPSCHPLIKVVVVCKKGIWQSRPFNSSRLERTTPFQSLSERRVTLKKGRGRRASGVRAALSSILHNEVRRLINLFLLKQCCVRQSFFSVPDCACASTY